MTLDGGRPTLLAPGRSTLLAAVQRLRPSPQYQPGGATPRTPPMGRSTLLAAVQRLRPRAQYQPGAQHRPGDTPGPPMARNLPVGRPALIQRRPSLLAPAKLPRRGT